MRQFSLIEILVVVIIVGTIIVAMVAGIKGENYCEMFKYSSMKDLPANCYSYYMEDR